MNETSNDTEAGPLNLTSSTSVEWSLMPSLSMFATVTGCFLNLFVLAFFVTHPNLRNPFTVYVSNVLIIDFILATAHGPLNVTEKLNPSWFLGLHVCKYYNYLSYTFQSLINFAHCLIAFNRVWAVGFPYSYRVRHKSKVAVVLCASLWIIVHSCQIPVAVLTSVIKPESANSSSIVCSVEPENVGVWSSISEICLYVLPLSFIIISYPIVCYKSFFSQAMRKHQVEPVTAYAANNDLRTQQRRSTVLSSAPESAMGAQAHKERDKRSSICGKKIHGSRTGYVTLTLMTLNVLVCLVPNEAYFTWLMITHNVDDSFDVYLVVDSLQRLTTVIDPILIVMGNTELRRAITKIFCFR